MDIEELKSILPHRPPMLLVQWAQLEEDGSAAGRYTFGGDEFFLQGHYPGNPVVPGVILCEILAQTCCVLLAGEELAKAGTPYFTGLDKVKFRRPVKPGECLDTRCRITRSKGPFYFAEGTGSVRGEVAVSAQFSFALVKADK